MADLVWREGSFAVSCCENGHISMEVLDQDGKVATVFTLSVAEAVDLARLLRVVAHEAERWKPQPPLPPWN